MDNLDKVEQAKAHIVRTKRDVGQWLIGALTERPHTPGAMYLLLIPDAEGIYDCAAGPAELLEVLMAAPDTVLEQGELTRIDLPDVGDIES